METPNGVLDPQEHFHRNDILSPPVPKEQNFRGYSRSREVRKLFSAGTNSAVDASQSIVYYLISIKLKFVSNGCLFI